MCVGGLHQCFFSVEEVPPWRQPKAQPHLATLQRRCRQKWAWGSLASWTRRACAARRGPAGCGIRSSSRASSCGGSSAWWSEPSARGRSTATGDTASPGRFLTYYVIKLRKHLRFFWNFSRLMIRFKLELRSFQVLLSLVKQGWRSEVLNIFPSMFFWGIWCWWRSCDLCLQVCRSELRFDLQVFVSAELIYAH